MYRGERVSQSEKSDGIFSTTEASQTTRLNGGWCKHYLIFGIFSYDIVIKNLGVPHVRKKSTKIKIVQHHQRPRSRFKESSKITKIYATKWAYKLLPRSSDEKNLAKITVTNAHDRPCRRREKIS